MSDATACCSVGSFARHSADDDDFTQQDARQFTRLMPYQNMLGVKNMIEALTSELPEQE